MNRQYLEQLLFEVQSGKLDIQKALKKLKNLPFEDLDFAKIDHHRAIRTGYPEIIYGEGKTEAQIVKIAKSMSDKGSDVLITRTSEKAYMALKKVCPIANYNEMARTITIQNNDTELTKTYIAIVAAGTSDLSVVEEAYESALILGNKVEKIVDVGVAGIHRLFDKLPVIQNAKVVIVIAGMEGALASVVGGLVDKPLIAVPTSVGYGASFGGIAALLSMLNSCAAGVSVVNIDNGFGAAYSASIINHL
jgi:NCAIR mutase (PurE)-related protein